MVLSHSAAMIFNKWLQDTALATPAETAPHTDWVSFINALPDDPTEPDAAISVYDTTPKKDGRIMAGEVIIHHGIQIRTRHNRENTVACYQKIAAIVTALDAINKKSVEVTYNTTENYIIHSISRNGILSLGTSTGERPRVNYSINLVATITQV